MYIVFACLFLPDDPVKICRDRPYVYITMNLLNLCRTLVNSLQNVQTYRSLKKALQYPVKRQGVLFILFQTKQIASHSLSDDNNRPHRNIHVQHKKHPCST